MDRICLFDPGYGKMWLPNENLRCAESKSANPYGGVAFRGTDCAVFRSVAVEDTGSMFVKIFHGFDKAYYQLKLKFSVCCKDMASGGSFSMGFATSKAATELDCCGITITNGDFKYRFPNVSGWLNMAVNAKNDDFYNISLLIQSIKDNDKYASRYVVCVNDKSLGINPSSAPERLPVYLGIWFPPEEAGRFYISNVIYCYAASPATAAAPTNQQPIPPNTQLMPLNLSEPAPNTFIPNGDEYIGTTKGQQLLQTVDTSNLIEKYSESAPVDTVVVYGNPGYRSFTFIETIYGISDMTTAKNTGFGSAPTTSGSNYGIDLQTPTTLGELNGKQVGWEIG